MSLEDRVLHVLEALPLLDLGLVLLVLLAAIRGWRAGATTQLARLAGAAIGLVAADLLGRWLIAGHQLGGSPLLVQAGCVVLGLLVGASLGARVGAPIGRLARGVGLGWLDGGLGALLRAGLALLACWFVAGLVMALGSPRVVSVVEGSALLARLDAALPNPGTVVARVLGSGTAGLLPVGTARARAPSDVRTERAAQRARGAVVKILGTACGQLVEGSGFAVGRHLVATNAHVVRGVSRASVVDAAGSHAGVPVSVDSSADIAILRVDELDATRLRLRRELAAPGTQGAVLGYPGGGPLRVSSAVVSARTPSIARRVGGGGIAVRELYRLRTTVRPGNSGGPFVDRRGRVAGVVTARSLSNDEVGYAVASTHVRAALRARSAGPVSTGGCAAP